MNYTLFFIQFLNCYGNLQKLDKKKCFILHINIKLIN